MQGTASENIAIAGTVHKFTACCPTVAVHVLWDFTAGVDARNTAEIAKKNGVQIGSINPNLFQDQAYKFGSCTSPDESARSIDSCRDRKPIGFLTAVGVANHRRRRGDGRRDGQAEVERRGGRDGRVDHQRLADREAVVVPEIDKLLVG